jgi:hypothetical protein
MNRLALLGLMFTMGLSADQDRKEISAGWPYDTLPQIADGAGWKTSIILANLDDHAVSWTVKFFGDDGTPKEFSLLGRDKASVFAGVLAKDASVTLETAGAGPLNQGWAEVSSSGGDRVGAMVIFGTFGVPGQPSFEASVPGVFSVDDDVVIPFDNMNGFVTSLAILNPGSYSDSVFDVRVLDEAGNVLKQERLVLKAGNKIAFSSVDRWAESRNHRGTISIKGEGLTSASSLALRFSPGGAFTTVFPMSR